mmetsp:Transcript_125114/g.325032  ORF Transcript_125114/g.325032 Transcript_125114/m.325032 type:complete len:81 (-) Transcript_125114:97-339(-)
MALFSACCRLAHVMLVVVAVLSLVVSANDALPSDCSQKCTKWPAICDSVEYCIASCRVSDIQRKNCQEYIADKQAKNADL